MKDWYKIAKEEERDYSWIHITVPKSIASQTVGFSESIPKEDLYVEEDEEGKAIHGDDWKYGVEDDPHITVKWGILTKDVDEIKELLKDESGGEVNLGKIDTFENEDYDVLKVNIDSKTLRKINKIISDNVENHDSHPTYNPHITLAYLKTGKGKDYKSNNKFKGVSFEFDEVVFEDYDDKATTIKLEA